MDTLWIAVLLEHLVIVIRFLCSTILIGSETSKPSVISCDEFKEQYYHLKAASAATALTGAGGGHATGGVSTQALNRGLMNGDAE